MAIFRLTSKGPATPGPIDPRKAAGHVTGIGLALVSALSLIVAAPAESADDQPREFSEPSVETNFVMGRRLNSAPGPLSEPSSPIGFQEGNAVLTRSGAQPLEVRLEAPDIPALHSVVEPPIYLGPQSVGNQYLPDSEVIYSPGAKDFDIEQFVAEQDGFLEIYREQVDGAWMTGAQIVERVAQNQSINPRLLLAVLEYSAGGVSDPKRPDDEAFYFPVGSEDRTARGLYLQLMWAANALSQGYYAPPQDPNTADSGKGNLALSQLSVSLCSSLDCGGDIIGTYRSLFGDPWEYAVELQMEHLAQPSMILPFQGTNEWVFSGGPHAAWGTDSPWAALDFAPRWDPSGGAHQKDVLAVADGVIARLDRGIVVLDLDRDGYEQTGWAILYLHIMAAEGIEEGVAVRQGQTIGQASSVAGVAAADHIHIARKYSGEWVEATGAVNFELGGWQARSGAGEYDGELYREIRGCGFTVAVGDLLHLATTGECQTAGLAELN